MAIKKLLQRLSLILLATLITFVLLCMYIPQRDTGNDDIMSMPVFEDMTYDNQAYIETVYMNGIMSYSGGGKFGVDQILTTNEAAYISVWIHEWKNHIDHSFEGFNPDSDELLKYLHGETVLCDKKGWTCVTVSGNPIGWGKASGGVLKNHYPKYLRVL